MWKLNRQSPMHLFCWPKKVCSKALYCFHSQLLQLFPYFTGYIRLALHRYRIVFGNWELSLAPKEIHNELMTISRNCVNLWLPSSQPNRTNQNWETFSCILLLNVVQHYAPTHPFMTSQALQSRVHQRWQGPLPLSLCEKLSWSKILFTVLWLIRCYFFQWRWTTNRFWTLSINMLHFESISCSRHDLTHKIHSLLLLLLFLHTAFHTQ